MMQKLKILRLPNLGVPPEKTWFRHPPHPTDT
jgi:hypothetical protein